MRGALGAEARAKAHDQAIARLLGKTDPAAAIAAYWPLAEEFDLRPALLVLVARGQHVGLPVVEGRGQPLSFRRWTPGMTMEPGAFGVPVPPPQAPALEPDVVIAPLLAFDAEGYRLGYGGGYYDLTLAALRRRRPDLQAGALAYQVQARQALPRDRFDQRLDWVVTEDAVHRFTALPAADGGRATGENGA